MHVVRASLMATLALGLWIAPGPAQAELDAETALEMARAQWFEGIPDDHLDRLSRDAHRALADLLADPAEIEHHDTAIEILGRAGGNRAFALIQRYQERADAANDEEISADAHRARLAIPAALGHLARRDDRALRHLLREVERGDAPRWRTKRISEERAAAVHREVCAIGLGLSGREEAAQALQRMRRAGDTPAWRRHVDASLELHRSRAGGEARR